MLVLSKYCGGLRIDVKIEQLYYCTVLNCPLIVWLMETSGKPLLVLELENGSSTQLHSLKLSRIEEA